MKKNKLLDASIPKFLLVGIGNTLVSAAIMFLLEGLGYWPSTAIAYIVGAVLSFFLNRKFTFNSKAKVGQSAVKFTVNIAVCYLLAYSIAQPLSGNILGAFGVTGIWLDRFTKIGGMGLYTVLNYFGQRFFAFR